MKHLSVPVSEEFDETIRKRMAEGGFGSIASFSRSYKACYGHSPSAGRFGPR